MAGKPRNQAGLVVSAEKLSKPLTIGNTSFGNGSKGFPEKKSPIRNQETLFNQNISFEMFHCSFLFLPGSSYWSYRSIKVLIFNSVLAAQINTRATRCTGPHDQLRNQRKYCIFFSLTGGEGEVWSLRCMRMCIELRYGNIPFLKLPIKALGRAELVEFRLLSLLT